MQPTIAATSSTIQTRSILSKYLLILSITLRYPPLNFHLYIPSFNDNKIFPKIVERIRLLLRPKGMLPNLESLFDQSWRGREVRTGIRLSQLYLARMVPSALAVSSTFSLSAKKCFPRNGHQEEHYPPRTQVREPANGEQNRAIHHADKPERSASESGKQLSFPLRELMVTPEDC